MDYPDGDASLITTPGLAVKNVETNIDDDVSRVRKTEHLTLTYTLRTVTEIRRRS